MSLKIINIEPEAFPVESAKGLNAPPPPKSTPESNEAKGFNPLVITKLDPLSHYKLPNANIRWEDHVAFLEQENAAKEPILRKGIKTDTDDRAGVIDNLTNTFPTVIKQTTLQNENKQYLTLNGDPIQVARFEVASASNGYKISTVLDYPGAEQIPCNQAVLKEVCKLAKELDSKSGKMLENDLNKIVQLLQSAGMLHYAELEGFTIQSQTTIAGQYQGIRFKNMTICGTVSLDLKTREGLDHDKSLDITSALISCKIIKGRFFGNMADLEISKADPAVKGYALICQGADLNGPAGSDWSKMKNYNPRDIKFKNDHFGGRDGSDRFDNVHGLWGSMNFETIKYLLGVRQPCLANMVKFGEGSPMDLYLGSYARKNGAERVRHRWNYQAFLYDTEVSGFSETTKKSLTAGEVTVPVKLPNYNNAAILRNLAKRDSSLITCEIGKKIFYVEAASSSFRGAYIAETSDLSKVAIAILDTDYIVRQHYICEVDLLAKALEEMRIQDVAARVKRTKSQMNNALDPIVGASKAIDDSSSRSLFDIAFNNFFESKKI